MRCSNITCGVEGSGKFCQQCGHEMVENPQTRTVVICTGKREDGSPCQSQLVPGQFFCMYCGIKVDQTLFSTDQEYCSRCKSLLLPGKRFCADCGQEESQPFQEVTKTIGKLENGQLTGNEIKPEVKEAKTIETSAVGNSNDTGTINEPENHEGNGVVKITGDTSGIKPKNENDDVSAGIDRDVFISVEADCLLTRDDVNCLNDVNDPRRLLSGEHVKNENGDISIRPSTRIDTLGVIICHNADESRNERSEKINTFSDMFEDGKASLVDEGGDKSRTDLSATMKINYVEKSNEGNQDSINENAKTHENDKEMVESLDSEIDSVRVTTLSSRLVIQLLNVKIQNLL